jgi:hypothetical protein
VSSFKELTANAAFVTHASNNGYIDKFTKERHNVSNVSEKAAAALQFEQ